MSLLLLLILSEFLDAPNNWNSQTFQLYESSRQKCCYLDLFYSTLISIYIFCKSNSIYRLLFMHNENALVGESDTKYATYT